MQVHLRRRGGRGFSEGGREEERKAGENEREEERERGMDGREKRRRKEREGGRGDLREGDTSHYLLSKEHHPGDPEEEDVVTGFQ